MKNLTILLLFTTISVVAQDSYSYETTNEVVQCYTCDKVIDRTPAPCSILNIETIAVKIVRIQVAVMTQPITSNEGVFAQKRGSYYYYYLNTIFTSKQQAEQYLSIARQTYCDAIIVDDPTGRITFIKSYSYARN